MDVVRKDEYMDHELTNGLKITRPGIVVPLRPGYVGAVDPPHNTLQPPIRSDFPVRLLTRHQNELSYYREYLRLRLTYMSSVEEPEAYQDLLRLLTLIDQQLASARRDHARCERMLEIYRNLWVRIVSNSLRIQQAGEERHTAVEFALSNDCDFAQRLANLMYLAAAFNPDESEYSYAWRKTLIAHSHDLDNLATASREKRPLHLPYYERDPSVTGFFGFNSKRTQAERVQELRQCKFVPLKQVNSTAAAFSEQWMQIALVDSQGGLRYIDAIDLINNYADFPDCKRAAYVDTSAPPSTSFTSQSGKQFKFVYDWKRLRYVEASPSYDAADLKQQQQA